MVEAIEREHEVPKSVRFAVDRMITAVEREQEMPRCPGSIHSRQRRVARTLLDALAIVRDEPSAAALLLGVEEAPQSLNSGSRMV